MFLGSLDKPLDGLNTHAPPVEEAELASSPPMPQPGNPTQAPAPLLPAPRRHPLIHGSRTQPTIPTAPPQPAPEQFAGHIQRSFPPGPVRPPFLRGIEEKILGQGAFGTVYLVHQTRGTDLKGARKVGAIPVSFEIPKAPHLPNEVVFKSLPIWKEYELLKRARDEGQPHVVAAIDQSLIHVPHEAPNRVIEDYPVIAETARLITITMEYALYGDLRFFMQERPRMFIEEAFFVWVGRQSLLGLK